MAGAVSHQVGDVQLPERAVTIHVISTDDPIGIEAYWHKRFEDRRKNGEWFELTDADLRVQATQEFHVTSEGRLRLRFEVARRFTIRSDVRKILGGQIVRALETDPTYRGVQCFRCGKLEEPDTGVLLAVSVIVAFENGKRRTRVRFPHPSCAPSTVTRGHPEHELDRATDLDGQMLEWEGLPFLIIARTAPGFAQNEDGSLIDIWGNYYKDAGFLHMKREPVDIGSPLTGWRIVIAPPVVEVVHADGMVDNITFKDIPDQWQDSIRRVGFCMLCTGSKINLDAPDLQGWLDRSELLMAPVSVAWRG